MKKALAGLFLVLALGAFPALGQTHSHRSHPGSYESTYDPSDWNTWPSSKANEVPWAPF